MVRDIKFRAWDIEENKMIIGNEKGLMLFLLMDECCVIRPLIKQKDDDWFLKGDFGGKYILMQYTGLKDKNGREIYEGDIVAGYKGDFVHNVIGVVKYCGLSFVFEGTTEENRYDISGGKGDNYWRYTVTNPSVKELPDIEIIGNIYENPELLKRHC